jgi:integrating conjugative element membrane protein (TIGR03747 family)
LFKTVLHGIGWLFLAGFFMLVGELASQWFFGQSAVLRHSQQLLHHEIKMVSEQLRKPLFVRAIQWQPRALSKDFVSLSQWESSEQNTPRLKAMIKPCILRLKISQQIFLLLLHCLMLLFMLTLIFLPLLGLLAVVGLVDGLTQRHLRKLRGARESSVLYLRSREWLVPSFFGAGVLYVGLPISLNPVMWFLTFAVLFSVLLSITARTYKKYL